jgi:hypothetical protein
MLPFAIRQAATTTINILEPTLDAAYELAENADL